MAQVRGTGLQRLDECPLLGMFVAAGRCECYVCVRYGRLISCIDDGDSTQAGVDVDPRTRGPVLCDVHFEPAGDVLVKSSYGSEFMIWHYKFLLVRAVGLLLFFTRWGNEAHPLVIQRWLLVLWKQYRGYGCTETMKHCSWFWRFYCEHHCGIIAFWGWLEIYWTSYRCSISCLGSNTSPRPVKLNTLVWPPLRAPSTMHLDICPLTWQQTLWWYDIFRFSCKSRVFR